MANNDRIKVPALIVYQWLDEWDKVQFSEDARRRKPLPYFYVFNLPALWLRRLSDIYRREADRPRSADTGIQRKHDPKRSDEISRFIHGGFPWSELSERQKQVDAYGDLRMPGWLPTAIVANILAPEARRGNLKVREEDAILVEHSSASQANLLLPENFESTAWRPIVYPIAIIDGQHRLWAFDGRGEVKSEERFELPVVAFSNLDVTWEAYLFYTINIKPKKINTSLAFDLYPILRVQDWLEKSPEGPRIYRDTRAQELTEVLWSHPDSPWRGRINMLGEQRSGPVTQAAFIRSLTSSYVKRREGPGVSVGGLFGAEISAQTGDVLQWQRPQQAAFLISVWKFMANAVAECQERWAQALRSQEIQRELPLGDDRDTSLDPAFVSKHSLLTTDQGVRGILQVTNDMCYVAAEELRLENWSWDDQVEEGIANEAVSRAILDLVTQPVSEFLAKISSDLCGFDWRTSGFPSLSDEERNRQGNFRGSSGYRELRRQLIKLLTASEDAQVQRIARDVYMRLGF